MLRPRKRWQSGSIGRNSQFRASGVSNSRLNIVKYLWRAQHAAPLRVLILAQISHRATLRYPCSQGSWPLCDSASKSIDTATAQ